MNGGVVENVVNRQVEAKNCQLAEKDVDAS